ncbi:MAG: histidine kinase [Ferruginibacter sp.]
MKGLIHFVMVILLLYLPMIQTAAQTFPNLQFEHFTTKDGLSSDAVSSITEDKTGFLWIGTNNGLNRYDGNRFKHYFHNDADSNSLIHNSIQNIFCDSKGRLWIATDDGVSCFLPAENRFINYNTRLPPPHHLLNNSSVQLYEDEAGIVWICNQLHLIYKVKNDFSLEEINTGATAFSIDNLEYKGYLNIYRDRQGNEWGFRYNHIYLLNKKTKQPEKTFDFSKIIKGQTLSILQNDDNKYWLATFGDGAWVFNPETGAVNKIDNLTPAVVINGMLAWTYKNANWLACTGANQGLYLVNKNDLSVRNYNFISGDPSSLQGINFNSIYTDRFNNLWLGTNRGLQRVLAQQNIFTVVPITDPGTNNYDLQRSGTVFSYFETDSSVWLSKRYISTSEYDKDFNLRHFYSSLYPLSAKKYPGNEVAYFYYKNNDELLITTDSGLVILNTKFRQAKHYFPSQFSKVADLRTIISFNKDEVLIRSFGFGLFVFNTANKKFTNWYSNKDTCAGCLPATVNYLFKSKKNKIYATTGGKGLFEYNKEKNSFLPVLLSNDTGNVLKNNFLYGMDEDREGKLWILGTDGIYIYNPASYLIEKHINENGRLGSLFRICFDNDDNAWVNGASGIWCYLRKKNKWVNFNAQDGLPGSDFENIIARRNNGDIAAGLEGAIAVFHPQKLLRRIDEAPVVITEVYIGNKQFYLPLQHTNDKKLTIHPGQNSFSVDFALLNYLSPIFNRYYYMLQPLMKDFQLNTDGHINFTGLAPGSYTLHVKGGDKAGNIFSNEDVLKIIVEPKWYQTGWFKLSCMALIGLLIFYFVKRRIRTIRKEASLKQKIAETEMQALRAQMNPHFIFNSLNGIENFMMQNEKRQASDYLNKFSRLIRSILDSSLNELVPVSKDMEALLLYVELEQLRFNNKFIYKANIDAELMNGDYKVPSLIIQPYVENAIVHGFANSDNKNLVLMVTVSLAEGYVNYIVEDNGIGREKAAACNLANKPLHKSVGMHITKERIALFNNSAQNNNDIQITDISSAGGTRVQVKIKLS